MSESYQPGTKVFYQGKFECYILRANFQTRTAYLIIADHNNSDGVFAAEFDLLLCDPEYLN